MQCYFNNFTCTTINTNMLTGNDTLLMFSFLNIYFACLPLGNPGSDTRTSELMESMIILTF